MQGQQLLEGLVAAEVFDGVIVAHAQTQQAQVAFDHIAGAHAQRGGEAPVDAIDASDLEALPDDGQPGVAGEGAATGAELDVGHGTVWVNGDIRYIAMQFSRLEAFLGAGLTDSGLSKHGTPEPLYDQDDADACMELFQPVDFYEEVQLGDIRFHLRPVGHILGAACIIIETEGKRIGFSGDVGRLNDIFMRPPAPLPALDMLMLESTYGNRRHDDADPLSQLADIVNETVDKGGNILIPAFAVGRAQVLQHMFTTLMKAGRIPVLPIYLDSPMAIDVSEIYCRYEDQHRLSSSECHEMCSTVHYSRSVQDSKALAGQAYPHVIIAGSGMATGGRILHHFKRLLGQHRTTVIFAGYQAGGTRGAKMIGGAERIKIHGDWFPVKARLEVLSGLSGHGDFAEIEQWLAQSDLAPETPINLIHGDPEALEALRDHLRQNTRFEVDVAGYQSILRL